MLLEAEESLVQALEEVDEPGVWCGVCGGGGVEKVLPKRVFSRWFARGCGWVFVVAGRSLSLFFL